MHRRRGQRHGRQQRARAALGLPGGGGRPALDVREQHAPDARPLHRHRRRSHRERDQGAALRLQQLRRPGLAGTRGRDALQPAVRSLPGRSRTASPRTARSCRSTTATPRPRRSGPPPASRRRAASAQPRRSRRSRSQPSPASRPRPAPTPAAARTSTSSPTAIGCSTTASTSELSACTRSRRASQAAQQAGSAAPWKCISTASPTRRRQLLDRQHRRLADAGGRFPAGISATTGDSHRLPQVRLRPAGRLRERQLGSSRALWPSASRGAACRSGSSASRRGRSATGFLNATVLVPKRAQERAGSRRG